MKRAIVEAFLKEWKQAMENGFSLINRDKNIEFLKQYNLNKKIVVDILKNLTFDSYVSGPEEDRDVNGEHVWIFLIDLEEIGTIYTKLKIYECNGIKYAKCISFHKSITEGCRGGGKNEKINLSQL